MDYFNIRLTDLRFFSKIGVFEQERKVGNEFLMNVEVRISASTFIEEDLESSISYADIFLEIKEVMGAEWLLLETVAKKIKDKLTARWPQIEGGKISIDKMAPPIAGIDGKCGIEYLF